MVKPTRSILLVSFNAPSRGHAGGLRLLELYRELRALRPSSYLALVAASHPGMDWGEGDLASVFDEVHFLPDEQFAGDRLSEIRFNHSHFDVIDLQYHQSGRLIDSCRNRWPSALVVFSPMESLMRSAALAVRHSFWQTVSSPRRVAALILNIFHEIRYSWAADRVIAVSESDRSVLNWIKSPACVYCVPTGTSRMEFPDPELSSENSGNRTVAFFAYFGSQTNRNALVWYCREVHPRIRQAVGDYRFRVIGRGLSSQLMDMCEADDVDFVGPVDRIPDGLADVSIGIAPALSGAGVRGKIHQYAMLGLPCVATPIAASGLSYIDGDSILVADNAARFADACTSLLIDVERGRRIGRNAREICLKFYAWTALGNKILEAYDI